MKSVAMALTAVSLIGFPAPVSAQAIEEAAEYIRTHTPAELQQARALSERRALRVLVGDFLERDFERVGPPLYSLGFAISEDTGEVRRVWDGSAGYQAGVRVGDRILAIDGRTTLEIALAGELQHGRVTFREPREVELVYFEEQGSLRSVRVIPTNQDTLPPAIEVQQNGRLTLIRVRRFDQNTGEEVGRTLREARDPVRVVLDLRQCSGGFISEALRVAEVFAPPGTQFSRQIWSTSERSVTTTEDHRADAAGSPHVVVLTSRFTSGSVELLAAFLASHAGALTIGERTAGAPIYMFHGFTSRDGGFSFAGVASYDCDDRLITTRGYSPLLACAAPTRSQYPDVDLERDPFIGRAVEAFDRWPLPSGPY